MKLKINKMSIGPEEKNELYAQGYRYLVDGDYAISSGTDPWSGMPNTTNNVYAFSDKAEAEAFAVKQIWVFNSNVHASVEELPPHTDTFEEWKAKEDAKKAQQKARREANERRRASEAGMTVEEYRAEKRRQKAIKTLTEEITALETELARKKALLKKLEG